MKDNNLLERLEKAETNAEYERKKRKEIENQKNFLKNRPLHPEGWSLIGDFSDVQNVFR